MDDTALTLVIDALVHPAPFEAASGLPPVVQTLQSADARTDLTFHPPVILCAEQDMARARGAFLVTGDGDGRVIAFRPAGAADKRLALLKVDRACVLSAGDLIPNQPRTTQLNSASKIQLLPASLKGVWVPEPAAWRHVCDSEDET